MSHQNQPVGEPTRIGRGQWMTLLAAFLGWMFDGFEMGLFPQVGRESLKTLLGQAYNEDLAGHWLGIMTAVFLIGAATGGVVFGWLGDRIGRVRAMTFSVLTYAIFMGLCGLAQNPQQMLVLRFFSALGMGGEWSLGVALVMELWPNKTRGLLAGLIGAAANVGFFLTAVVTMGMARLIPHIDRWLFKMELPEVWRSALMEHSAWRLVLLIGAAPAALTFFIRLFVPESERWQREHSQGKTSHWATQDLLGVVVGVMGLALIILVWTPGVWKGKDVSAASRITGSLSGFLVALGGFIYPVLRYLQRARTVSGGPPVAKTLGRMLLGACLSGVAFIATWGAVQWGPIWAGILVEQKARAEQEARKDQLADETVASQEARKAAVVKAASDARSKTQMVSGIGAIIGTIAGALLGNLIGRRLTYSLLCIMSYLATLAFFNLNNVFDTKFLVLSFAVGTLTASFYGWLPLYLPELFSTNIRATGQGFGFNFGRILAAIGALQFGNLVARFGGYPGACTIIISVYLIGTVLIWIAPETRGQPLPD